MRAVSPESLWVHRRPGSQVLTASPLDSAIRLSSNVQWVASEPKLGTVTGTSGALSAGAEPASSTVSTRDGMRLTGRATSPD
jgi:hypothetical protein